MVVLVCIGSLAACSSEDGTVGNTELNVVVPNGGPGTGGGSSAPGLIDIQSVEYTINCTGTPQTFLDNNTPLPNDGAVQINGNLEVVDGRTDPQGPIPPEFGTARPGDGAEVWQGFMDLPVGPCTIQLRARDNDGEVICTATESFDILPSTTSKVNLVMICDTSFQAPVGMLDVDATFSFVVGNFCPDLFVVNCLDSNPPEVQILPPPNPPIAGTTCEVRARDVDSTCGQSCDPQQCTPTSEGLDCVPGPDPGVSTTVTCTDLFIDCDGDGTADPSCTWGGDLTGAVGGTPPSFPGAPGDGNFFVTCIPPALGGSPGVTGTCTAVTTDGDEDCDKTKVVEVTCPGLTQCQNFDQANGGTGTQAGADALCDDGNSCTANVCDNGTCDGATAGACCASTDLAAGTACTDGGGFPGTCDGAGTCVSTLCTAQPDPDAFCDDGNPCTVAGEPGSCLGDGSCDASATNEGGACDAGGGAGTGSCTSGACVDNCDGVVCDDGNDCTSDPACDSAGGGICPTPIDEPAGTSCDPGTGNPGECDGAGSCIEQQPVFCSSGSGSTQWIAQTDPVGSNGGPTATGGGCEVFVTALNTTIFLQATIDLDMTSDGANNVTTAWGVTAQQFLLPTLGNAAELGALDIPAVTTGGVTGGPFTSGLTAGAQGQLIGAFITGDQLAISTPGEITAGGGAVTPTDGVPGSCDFNWDGTFALDLTLGGMPLVVVDESVCAFTVLGPDISFPTTN